MNKADYLFTLGVINNVISNIRNLKGINKGGKLIIDFKETLLPLKERIINKKLHKIEKLEVTIYYFDQELNIKIPYVTTSNTGEFTKTSKEQAIHVMSVAVLSAALYQFYTKNTLMEDIINGTYRGNNPNQ